MSESEGTDSFRREQRTLVVRTGSGEHSLPGISGKRGVLEQQRRVEDSRGTSREEVSRMVCISNSVFVLLLGPWVLLFLLEAALCIIYVRECRDRGIVPIRTVSRRREEASVFAVSNV